MSHFDSAITPVAGVGANIRSRRQSGCPGGAQAQLVTAEIILTLNELLLAAECTMFDGCNCPNRCKELV